MASRERPWNLGPVAARVDEDSVARFGDLDPGPWHAAAVFVDEFDREGSPAHWKDVEPASGEHHELTLGK